MVKHIFPPDGYAALCASVPFSDLLYALVSKRLGRDCWPPYDRPKTRPPRDKKTLHAWRLCEEKLFDALCSDDLVAHAYVERTGHFRRIPRHYWNENGSALCTSGYIFDLIPGKTFNMEIHGSNVYVGDAIAKEWLIKQGISGIDPFCPEMLRLKRKPAPSRRTKYHWPAFEDEVVCRLGRYRTRSPQPLEAELVTEMSDWCSLTWDRCPDPKMIRQHLRLAQARFQQEQLRKPRN